jgi:hypothetical protein
MEDEIMRDEKKELDIDEILDEKNIEKADILFRVLLSVIGGIQYWLLLYLLGYGDELQYWGIDFYPLMLGGFPVLIYTCVKFLKKIF